MPATAAEIVRLLDLERNGADLFVGPRPRRSALEKTYGGQLVGQALVAAARTVDDCRPAHSLHGLFLAAGNPTEPVTHEVARVRDGRSFSLRTVSSRQGGREVFRLTASFQPVEEGLAHQLKMPVVPSPGDVPTLHEVMRSSSSLEHEEWRAEWAGVELRYIPDNLARSTNGEGPGVQQLWVRVNGALPDDAALHRHVIAYLSDLTLLSTSLLPHGIMLGSAELPRATLNHSVWFHQDARADEWLLVDQRSPWAGGARGLSFAAIYTADGAHVASLAQEGLIRPHGQLRRRLGLS